MLTGFTFTLEPLLKCVLGSLGGPQQHSPHAEMAAQPGQAAGLLQRDRIEPRLPGDAVLGPFQHDTRGDSAKVQTASPFVRSRIFSRTTVGLRPFQHDARRDSAKVQTEFPFVRLRVFHILKW